jgi:hypothetical protein
VARLLQLLCCAAVAAFVAAPASAAARPAEPVPSLTPAKTAKLWKRLVSQRGRHRFASAACTPARVVFYSPTGWMDLATRLAADPSPCAQYFVGVPPLANDKTTLRAGYAAQIRALGPNFHALAEISVTGWTQWVSATGNGWYAAGVEARSRMAAAGFDVAAGDTWSLNELSTAVRAGTGNARTNMRAFLNGLHDGPSGPGARGVVFTAGIAQSTAELSVYQARLQDWYEDAAFWNDLARVTSDWSQEVYGDVRAYAAPGMSREARRDALNEYLQHPTALAAAAPASAAAARALLDATSAPLANAAWRYDAAFGWTDVELETMQDYVSAQTYALRAAGTGGFGFAWSPKNLTGASDFAARADALLVRLAASIADSDGTPEGACGTSWCGSELAGAALTSGWRSFATWRPSQLAFSTPPQELEPGAASAPVAVELRTSTGVPYTAGLPVAVELSAGSPTAELAPSPAGPWSRTLAASIASGSTSTSFVVRDAAAGSFTIVAAAQGKAGSTQAVTVRSGPPQPPPPPSAPGSGGAGPAPDVALTADLAPAAPAVGAPVTFTIRARNGGGPAGRVLLAVRLPEGVEYLSSAADRGGGCTPSAEPAGTALACDLDFLSGSLVATVRVQAVVRRPGALVFGAVSTSEPADGQPGNDAVSLTTSVPAPQPAAAEPDRAPALRAPGPAVLTRREGVATVRLGFTVSEAAALQARVTRAGRSAPLPLLRSSTLAGRRATRPSGAVTGRAPRAGSYVAVLRLDARRLVRGRAHVLRLTATDLAGTRRTLTVRVAG